MYNWAQNLLKQPHLRSLMAPYHCTVHISIALSISGGVLHHIPTL
jgi:hypothetical protein